MKNFLISIGLLALLGSCGSKEIAAAAPGEEAPAASTTLQKSAYSLFEVIDRQTKSEENTFVSPLSVQQAMGLVHAGALGKTASEIEAAFGLASGTSGTDQLEAQRIAVVGSDQAVRVKIANAIWLSDTLKFRPAYLDTTRQNFAAQAERLDFANDQDGSARTINAWADRHTEGLIREIVSPSGLDATTAAILTNAVFFEGKWQLEFLEARPQPFLFGDGTEKPFPLMNRQGEYRYAEASGWKAVRLPYGADGRFVMDVFVPRDRSVDARLTARTFDVLGSKLDQTHPEPVVVAMPRCEIEWEEGLNSALQTLGVKAAFNSAFADLTGMAEAKPGRLVVSSVKQKSKLQIFETGTRAAAVTAVVIMVTGAPANPIKPKVFRADQPFHLAIRDTRSGTILFVGRIAKPALYTGGQLQ